MAGKLGGRPRTLPDADELHRLLVVERKTQAAVARQYGVTRAAVSSAVRRLNIDSPKAPRYDDFIPWVARTEHHKAYPLRMLRLYARRQTGQPLDPKESHYLELFLERLRSIDGVVGYDEAEGFYYVKARDVDRPGVIRKPDWLFDGDAQDTGGASRG
jgi:hypothetical protein